MKRLSLAAATAALVSCGPPPAQIAGSYSGGQNLVVTGGAGETSSEVVSVSQTGGDISFTLGMCGMKGNADGAASFHIQDFKCTKYLASQAWELTGNGKLTFNSDAISIQINGTGKNGAVTSPLTWSFSGSRSR